MITQNFLKQGAFELRLIENVPASIRAALTVMGHIVVTHNWVDVRGMSDTAMLGVSAFTGVIVTKTPDGVTGADLVWWISDDNGVGDVVEGKVTNVNGSLNTWITALFPNNGITIGTVTNTGNVLSHTFYLISRRDALNYVCAAVAAEWRVNPNGKLDVGPSTSVFADYVTPDAIAVRRDGGHDPGLIGLEVADLVREDDASDFTTKVILVAQGEGSSTAVATASSGVTTYKGLGGATAIRERMVDSPQTEAGNEATVAQSSLNLFSSVRQKISLSTRFYDVTHSVTPGSSLWVYDAELGVFDTAQKVLYRGNWLMPRRMRVHSVQWPIATGMGVYYRDASGAYLDLTPFVAFEDGQATTYDVGSIDAPVWADILPTSRTGAEANEDIYERVKRGPWLTYTPTLTQGVTVAKNVTYAKYVQFGTYVFVTVYLDVTGAGTANNPIEVGLPVAASAANRFFGPAELWNGASHFSSHAANVTSTTVVRFRDLQTTGNVYQGQTGSTWGSAAINGSHAIQFSLSYEAA